VKWEIIDQWKPSGVFARYMVRTAAKTEAEFRFVIQSIKQQYPDASNFDVDFISEGTPKPPSLTEMINAGDKDKRYDAYDATVIARFDGDKLDIYSDRANALPIEGVHAVELYPSQVLNLYSVVVRVDKSDQVSLKKVADFYENLYGRPEGLTIYFTTSETKWDEYPRVYPASVPKEIVMVYSRYHNGGEFVAGSKFK
jgi:hypothetical protein